MRSVIAVYVENKYGVLTRVSGLFMRKGFNIDSLTVGETDDPDFSRITIVLNGDDYAREQLINQVKKLHNVKRVKLLADENSVERELLLIKFQNTPGNREAILAATEQYCADLIGETETALCVEVIDEPAKINSFIEAMRPLGIIESCRTGAVALEKDGSIFNR